MPHMKAAFDRLDQLTEGTFRNLGIRHMLYVGWRHDCHPWWYRKLAPALGVEKITIAEVHPPNAGDAEQKAWNGEFGVNTVIWQGDIRQLPECTTTGIFDMIYWDHGPEHVSFEDLKKVTPSLVQLSNKLLLYSCPWGHWPQSADGGNEHERHLWDVTPEHMEQLGMLWCTVGEAGQDKGGEIIAWKCK